MDLCTADDVCPCTQVTAPASCGDLCAHPPGPRSLRGAGPPPRGFSAAAGALLRARPLAAPVHPRPAQCRCRGQEERELWQRTGASSCARLRGTRGLEASGGSPGAPPPPPVPAGPYGRCQNRPQAKA